MKKKALGKVRNLTLSRETLQVLEESNLSKAPGGYPISAFTGCSDCSVFGSWCYC
ncbi:MAG TPA: hypothetical protein VFR03_19530 [Thermoanaerobaculia bacterium]|nr:hypothetical protein [Thermoanaerobaculia bacterium]